MRFQIRSFNISVPLEKEINENLNSGGVQVENCIGLFQEGHMKRLIFKRSKLHSHNLQKMFGENLPLSSVKYLLF